MKLFDTSIKLFIASLAAGAFFSCDGFLTIEPPKNQAVSESVYGSDATAISAIVGIYARMSLSTGFASGGNQSVTLLTGLSSDELQNFSTTPERVEFYTNNLLSANSVLKSGLWEEAFRYIYYTNSVLEGLAGNTRISSSVSEQLQGEALFLRAFIYFYLTNLFGDVPILLTTDYRFNAMAARKPINEVYLQILDDLNKSQALLSESYTTAERVRPNKWVATSLLSRVHLYLQNWEEAEQEASKVIDNPLYQLEPDLDKVFLRNSREAIWQLMPVAANINTREGQSFILLTRPSNIALSPSIVPEFGKNDQRALKWIQQIEVQSQTYFYPFKYKIRMGTPSLEEYSMVFRLAEQHLIRAEARARLNKLTLARADLNLVRERAGLLSTEQVVFSQSELLDMIRLERRLELFTEWGHRWLDLKRSGVLDSVMTAAKGPTWSPFAAYYPIPLSEIEANSNLLPQNAGY